MIIAIILLLGVTGGLISLLFKLLKKPMKWAFKLLLHAAFGFVTLLLFNFVGAWFQLSLDITWLSAIIAGVLGIPGVFLLLILKFLL